MTTQLYFEGQSIYIKRIFMLLGFEDDSDSEITNESEQDILADMDEEEEDLEEDREKILDELEKKRQKEEEKKEAEEELAEEMEEEFQRINDENGNL